MTVVRHAVQFPEGFYVASVGCALGITKWLKVEVKLHHMVVSPFLFAALKDGFTGEISKQVHRLIPGIMTKLVEKDLEKQKYD